MTVVVFCKQTTAYELRISDWSSDVCSSDLASRMALDRQIEQMEIRAILLRELNHRVKNTLATVNSLAALAREGATDVSSYYTALNGRLRALSATHDLLTSSDWGDTDLRDIAEAELAPFNAGGNMVIDGHSVRFGTTKALSAWEERLLGKKG